MWRRTSKFSRLADEGQRIRLLIGERPARIGISLGKDKPSINVQAGVAVLAGFESGDFFARLQAAFDGIDGVAAGFVQGLKQSLPPFVSLEQMIERGRQIRQWFPAGLRSAEER